MNETDILMVFLATLQPAMLGVLTFAAFHELRVLDKVDSRREANPSIRAGLALIGFGCFGRFMLSVRALIAKLLDYSGKSLFALMNLPGPLVECASTIATMVAIAGILLLIRGNRAVLYREASGDVARASGEAKILGLLLLLALLALGIKG